MIERVRHRKRGTCYSVVTRCALLQSAEPIGEAAVLVIYKGDDGRFWARPESEFDDGRFEPMHDQQRAGK